MSKYRHGRGHVPGRPCMPDFRRVGSTHFGARFNAPEPRYGAPFFIVECAPMGDPGWSKGHEWSKTWTFFNAAWHEGNIPIMGVRTHAAWLGTSVFDGARAFEGVTPDLDLHCTRVNRSAIAMGLRPLVSVENWLELTDEGLEAVRARRRALYPPDVLGRGARPGHRRRRPRIDPLVPQPL